jgi:RNA polymerase sigma-70 factor (ECF subfamily)
VELVPGSDDLDAPGARAVPVDFEPFCASIYPRLVGSLSLAYGDRGLAEEIAQEALSRVLEHWDRVGTLRDAEGYTFQTAFNVARSWWRRRAAEHRANSRSNSHSGEAADHDHAPAIAVRRALADLPPRQREAIVHRYFLGHNVSETARSMGCAEGTVKALTSQAVAKLRAELGVPDE